MFVDIANFVEMTAGVLVDVVPTERPQGIPFVAVAVAVAVAVVAAAVVAAVAVVAVAAAVSERAANAAAAPLSFDVKLVAVVGSASTFAATSVKELVEPQYEVAGLSGKGYSVVPYAAEAGSSVEQMSEAHHYYPGRRSAEAWNSPAMRFVLATEDSETVVANSELVSS